MEQLFATFMSLFKGGKGKGILFLALTLSPLLTSSQHITHVDTAFIIPPKTKCAIKKCKRQGSIYTISAWICTKHSKIRCIRA